MGIYSENYKGTVGYIGNPETTEKEGEFTLTMVDNQWVLNAFVNGNYRKYQHNVYCTIERPYYKFTH